VLINALFFIISSLELFGINTLLNCYGLEQKSFWVTLAMVEAGTGS